MESRGVRGMESRGRRGEESRGIEGVEIEGDQDMFSSPLLLSLTMTS